MKASFILTYKKVLLGIDEDAPAEQRYRFREDAKLRANALQLVMTQLNSENDSGNVVIKPFNVVLKYWKVATELFIDILVEAISIYFSYQEFSMIMDIVNALKPPETNTTAQPNQNQLQLPQQQKTESTTTIAEHVSSSQFCF